MKRRFTVTIDSGNTDEPMPRRYATYEQARQYFFRLDPRWQRFAWITEDHDDAASGVIVRMRDGHEVR